jgi:5'-3' exonuclease
MSDQIHRNLIIDGNNLAYRCRYSFDLSNNGMDVSIVYGFLRVLLSLISKFQADTVLVAWDYGIPEHRRKRMPEYKANRKSKKEDDSEYEDMIRQMNVLERMLPMFGVVSVRIPSCEADDIMYHASRIFVGHSIIVSTDKDMLQAINSNTKVWNPAKEILYDKDEFEEEYGIELNQFVEWLALQGDKVDNIIGVPGIGPVNATKLMNKWGSMTRIVNAALGIDPDKTMSPNIATKIVSVGDSKLTNNIFVIALFADRAGTRHHIRMNVSKFMDASIPAVKRFLMDNAFVSLVDKVGLLRKLSSPELLDGVRYPMVCNYRRSYGKNK